MSTAKVEKKEVCGLVLEYSKEVEKSSEDIMTRALILEAVKNGAVIHVGKSTEKKSLTPENFLKDVEEVIKAAYENNSTVKELIDKKNIRAVIALAYNGAIIVGYYDNVTKKVLRVAGKRPEYNKVDVYFLIV